MEATYETEEAAEEVIIDQLQPSETLIDRGVDDALDEGIIAPFAYSAGQSFGNTPREMREGETLEMRIKQEEPERAPTEEDPDWNPLKERRQVGSERAGRLVAHSHGYDSFDHEKEAIGEDVGLAGGAATAEEAAMHIIHEEDIDSDVEEDDSGI